MERKNVEMSATSTTKSHCRCLKVSAERRAVVFPLPNSLSFLYCPSAGREEGGVGQNSVPVCEGSRSSKYVL